jgi:hypothetical protein
MLHYLDNEAAYARFYGSDVIDFGTEGFNPKAVRLLSSRVPSLVEGTLCSVWLVQSVTKFLLGNKHVERTFLFSWPCLGQRDVIGRLWS